MRYHCGARQPHIPARSIPSAPTIPSVIRTSELMRRLSGRRVTEPRVPLRQGERAPSRRRASYTAGSTAIPAAIAAAQATPMGQRKSSLTGAPNMAPQPVPAS